MVVNMNKYASRKFMIATFILISATALCAYDKITANQLTLLYGLVGTGYGFVNYKESKNG